MSQVEALHSLFQQNSNRLTLGQILNAWEMIGSNETGRLSDLRKVLEPKGYTIRYTRGKRPTDNLYEIVALQRFPVVEGQSVIFQEAV